MVSEETLKRLWRTKYPWIIAVYILLFSFLRVSATNMNKQFALNYLMIAAVTSYIFLFIFYIYGVRPPELEHHFR